MCILAIFRGDQLNHWRDMVVFLFFKMAATAILDLLYAYSGPPAKSS